MFVNFIYLCKFFHIKRKKAMNNIDSGSGVLEKKIKLRIKDTAVTLKIIGWLQLVGGVTGMYLMGRLLLQTGTITGPILFILLTGISLFLFSAYVGKRLLTANDKNGIRLSILNQALQLFNFHLFGFGFGYSAGANFLFGVKQVALDFDFSFIFSTFHMSIYSVGEYFFKINFLAVLLIMVLCNIYNENRHKL